MKKILALTILMVFCFSSVHAIWSPDMRGIKSGKIGPLKWKGLYCNSDLVKHSDKIALTDVDFYVSSYYTQDFYAGDSIANYINFEISVKNKTSEKLSVSVQFIIYRGDKRAQEGSRCVVLPPNSITMVHFKESPYMGYFHWDGYRIDVELK